MRNFAMGIALLAFLAALPPVAFASGLSVTGLSDYVVFKEVPVPLSFSVTNDSGVGGTFSFELRSPAKYEVVGALPKFLKDRESAKISLMLNPPAGIEGQYYKGKLVFILGAQKTEKEIKMNFLPAEGCTIDFSASAQKSGKGLVLSVRAKNNSVGQKSFILKRLEKVPSDWAQENAAQVKIEGLEAKSIDFGLAAQSSYKGKGTAVFLCAGKEAKAEFNADFNGQKSALTGLVSGIGTKGNANWALNIALFVIAAILVLAFASRYLKRIGRK